MRATANAVCWRSCWYSTLKLTESFRAEEREEKRGCVRVHAPTVTAMSRHLLNVCVVVIVVCVLMATGSAVAAAKPTNANAQLQARAAMTSFIVAEFKNKGKAADAVLAPSYLKFLNTQLIHDPKSERRYPALHIGLIFTAVAQNSPTLAQFKSGIATDSIRFTGTTAQANVKIEAKQVSYTVKKKKLVLRGKITYGFSLVNSGGRWLISYIG